MSYQPVNDLYCVRAIYSLLDASDPSVRVNNQQVYMLQDHPAT